MTQQRAPERSVRPLRHGDLGDLTPCNQLPSHGLQFGSRDIDATGQHTRPSKDQARMLGIPSSTAGLVPSNWRSSLPRHLAVRSIDILSPFCVRAKLQKIGISSPAPAARRAMVSFSPRWTTSKPCSSKHFEERIVIPDEEPAETGIELRGTERDRLRQVPVHDVAIETRSRRERCRDHVVGKHAVVRHRPGRSTTRPAAASSRIDRNRDAVQPVGHADHAGQPSRGMNRPDNKANQAQPRRRAEDPVPHSRVTDQARRQHKCRHRQNVTDVVPASVRRAASIDHRPLHGPQIHGTARIGDPGGKAGQNSPGAQRRTRAFPATFRCAARTAPSEPRTARSRPRARFVRPRTAGTRETRTGTTRAPTEERHVPPSQRDAERFGLARQG